MVFEDMKICILSGFSGFTKLSAEVIARNIKKSAGQVVSPADPEFNLESLTCVIVPEAAQITKILEVLHVKSLPACPLVTPSWAIESYSKKESKEFSKYLYINYQLPSKSEADKQPVVKVTSFQGVNSSPEKIGKFEKMKSLNTDYLKNDKTLKQDFLENKEKYAFSHTQGPNLNEHITSVLEVLMENYFLLKDKARAFAYRFAISTLKSHPEKIICTEQAENLQKIGKAIKKKIGEILETGSLKRVKAMEDMERLKALKVLSSIWGIGSTTASKLYSLGYRTLEDLRKKVPDFLTENQKVCLELFEELETKIPREEVKIISDLVVGQAKELLCGKSFIANTCGSYRRGRELCGDIDVLITFDDILENKEFLAQLVQVLHEKNIVTHTLVLSLDVKKHENFTFSGIAKVEGGLHRRLDIKIYPRRTYVWALMHFTGSASFNRSFRLFAKNKGLKMTDEGLFPAFRNGSETLCGGRLVDCFTEEDIFNLFDMPFKSPEERDL
jgi:DNA polymerase/3'-5' exonuclease PolX